MFQSDINPLTSQHSTNPLLIFTNVSFPSKMMLLLVIKKLDFTKLRDFMTHLADLKKVG